MRRAALLLALLPLLCACSESREGTGSTADIPSLRDSASFSANNAYAHCARLCALGPRHSGSPAYEAQLTYLEGQLRAAGWQTRREAFSPRQGIRMTNLHATYGSDAAAARPLLVSCHIDTKQGIANFIGADDGATGAGVIVEAARVLAKQNPEQAAQIELIFFDGEEAFGRRMSMSDGMYGSRHDVERRASQGIPLPKWQINLDMVGGKDMMIAPPALDTSADMIAQYERAADSLGLDPMRWTAYPGTYLDDHLPYVEAGVDALNLIAYFQRSDWWHTEKDNLERISQKSLEESGRMLMRLVGQLLEAGLPQG